MNFQHHYSSLQCHMIFRNHNNMLICCSRNISDYYQCWQQLCCFIFLWKTWYILFFRIFWWTESSKEQHLFETEIFCNIINIFTVTFEKLYASSFFCNILNVRKSLYCHFVAILGLLNKSINFIQKKTVPKLLSTITTKRHCDWNVSNTSVGQ